MDAVKTLSNVVMDPRTKLFFDRFMGEAQETNTDETLKFRTDLRKYLNIYEGVNAGLLKSVFFPERTNRIRHWPAQVPEHCMTRKFIATFDLVNKTDDFMYVMWHFGAQAPMCPIWVSNTPEGQYYQTNEIDKMFREQYYEDTQSFYGDERLVGESVVITPRDQEISALMEIEIYREDPNIPFFLPLLYDAETGSNASNAYIVQYQKPPPFMYDATKLDARYKNLSTTNYDGGWLIDMTTVVSNAIPADWSDTFKDIIPSLAGASAIAYSAWNLLSYVRNVFSGDSEEEKKKKGRLFGVNLNTWMQMKRMKMVRTQPVKSFNLVPSVFKKVWTSTQACSDSVRVLAPIDVDETEKWANTTCSYASKYIAVMRLPRGEYSFTVNQGWESKIPTEITNLGFSTSYGLPTPQSLVQIQAIQTTYPALFVQPAQTLERIYKQMKAQFALPATQLSTWIQGFEAVLGHTARDAVVGM